MLPIIVCLIIVVEIVHIYQKIYQESDVLNESITQSNAVSETLTLSVVIPAYNEGKNIRAALESIITEVSKCNLADYEVIIIDDGSGDSSAEILNELANQNDKVRVIIHPDNLGKGAALTTGFRQAQMEWILFTDADLQIEMKVLPLFIEQIGQYELLVGCRENRVDPWSRRIISKSYNLLIRKLFGVRLRDAHCPFKLFKRSFIDSIHLVSRGFFVDTELVCLAMAHGCRIGEFRVNSCRRQSGVSSVKLSHVFETVRELLRFLHKLSTKSGNEA